LKPHPAGLQVFYLVILDNGRRELATDPEMQEALHCLRCGACLNVCPVFQVGAAHLYKRVYPGAIGILLAPYLAPRGDISDLCAQCGACQEICPVKIRLTEKIIRMRRFSPKFRGLHAASRLAGWGLRLPWLYRGLEPGLRLVPRLIAGLTGRVFPGFSLAPRSFHRRRKSGERG
jgi:L-lactate dehydrogenase complex protein LldF